MKNSYWTHQLLSMRQAIQMLRQKTVIWPRKREIVTSINKIGKTIRNKKKIKNQTNNRKKENQLSLGDSMVKHLNGWEISKEIKNCKVYE